MQTSGKISVLVVDDHPMVREGLRSMLKAPDIQVVGEAGTGRQAVALVQSLAPDVVLMDIRMPDMDGLEAMARIKRVRPSTRVIIVTTYQSTAYLLRALAGGASGFVLKDISREALLNTIRSVVAGGTGVDEQFLQQALRQIQGSVEPDETVPKLLEPLTPREMDILWLMAEGLTNAAIARALGISPTTVKSYVQTILQKLDATDRTQAVVKAFRLGLIR